MAGAKKFSTEQELVMLREYVSAIEKRYQAVSRVVAILNTDLSLKESVRGVATVLQDLIPYDRFTLVLALMNREYEVEGGPFLSQQMEYRIIQASDSNASQWVLHNKRALLRKDISKEQRFEGDARRIQEGMYSDLVVPLMVVDEVVGTFSFTAQKANQFQETHLETAQSVADTIAVMFKQLQMRNSLGLKQAEVALRETERIQVLAETAGATAHEINQPLQVIMGLE